MDEQKEKNTLFENSQIAHQNKLQTLKHKHKLSCKILDVKKRKK